MNFDEYVARYEAGVLLERLQARKAEREAKQIEVELEQALKAAIERRELERVWEISK